jgi:DNA-binding transcriptional MocR family regulator
MFVWVSLPDDMDGKALLARALAEERIAFVPGAPFFAEAPENNTLRLSYSLPTDDQIETGVERLARLIRSAVATE